MLPKIQLKWDPPVSVLEQIDSKLLKTLSRHKCLTVLPWELGWGVYANVQNIQKIKENTNFAGPK